MREREREREGGGGGGGGEGCGRGGGGGGGGEGERGGRERCIICESTTIIRSCREHSLESAAYQQLLRQVVHFGDRRNNLTSSMRVIHNRTTSMSRF